MSSTDIVTPRRLTWSEATMTAQGSAADVEIAGWLSHLPEAEYPRCAPPDQKVGASTTTDDGGQMTLEVEENGGTLLIQHRFAETHGPQHCRAVSLPDARATDGWTQVQVIWDLRVVEETPTTCAVAGLVITSRRAAPVGRRPRSGSPAQTLSAAAHSGGSHG